MEAWGFFCPEDLVPRSFIQVILPAGLEPSERRKIFRHAANPGGSSRLRPLSQACASDGPACRKTCRTREQAHADVFDYIERFYNPTRRHSTQGYVSPVQFEEASKA
jgi:transposase InsO family protein